jgi:hypothetical protein
MMSSSSVVSVFSFLLLVSASLLLLLFMPTTTDGLAFGGETPNIQKTQLEIAFVTGNEMKVRELTNILAAEGAIDLDHPEKSLGRCGKWNTYMMPID